MIFTYNTEKFTKVHLLRTGSVLGIYLFVFFFNFFRLEPSWRSGYLRLFLPLTLILFFFLYKNFKKQIGVLRGSYVELSDNALKQYAWNGQFIEVDLRKIISIKRDKYRMYDRITLEDNENFFYLVNLQEPEKFLQEIEKTTGKTH